MFGICEPGWLPCGSVLSWWIGPREAKGLEVMLLLQGGASEKVGVRGRK